MVNLETLIDEIQTELGYEYPMLRPVTYEQIKEDYVYRKKIVNVQEAKAFNYHSDYWGTDDEYQEQNVTAMRMIKPYINKVIEYEGKKLKLIAMLIDRQYNAIGHTDLLVETV